VAKVHLLSLHRDPVQEARRCRGSVYRSNNYEIRCRGVHAPFVQELLGYATIAITLDTYSHVLLGMSDRLADVTDESLR
jgi:hypothetical protein